MAKVEFHFDFGSPNAYLAHLVVPEVERRTGVNFEYVPVLLGGVFKMTNNRSPAESMASVKNRLEYEQLERQRFIHRYGITQFTWNPYFPVNTLLIMRGAVAAQFAGRVRTLRRRGIQGSMGRAEKDGRSRGRARRVDSNPALTRILCLRARRMPRSRTGC